MGRKNAFKLIVFIQERTRELSSHPTGIDGAPFGFAVHAFPRFGGLQRLFLNARIYGGRFPHHDIVIAASARRTRTRTFSSRKGFPNLIENFAE